MRIAVVDASVVGKWLLPGEADSPGAARLIEDHRMRRVALIAPHVLEHEVTSMIWKAVREGRVSPDASTEILLRARSLGIMYGSGSQTSLDTLSLSNSLRQTPYDCSYLAVALEIGCNLYTADRRFAATAREAYQCVKDIEDYPGEN